MVEAHYESFGDSIFRVGVVVFILFVGITIIESYILVDGVRTIWDLFDKRLLGKHLSQFEFFSYLCLLNLLIIVLLIELEDVVNDYFLLFYVFTMEEANRSLSKLFGVISRWFAEALSEN